MGWLLGEIWDSWIGNGNVVFVVCVGHVDLCMEACLSCGNYWIGMVCELVCFGLE